MTNNRKRFSRAFDTGQDETDDEWDNPGFNPWARIELTDLFCDLNEQVADAPPKDLWAVNGGVYFGHQTETLQGEEPPLGEELRYVGDRHLFTVGANGSGKTRRTLLVATADLTQWSMLIVDVKGEIAKMTMKHRERFGSEIVLINPFDVFDMGSRGFNPIAVLDPTSPEFPDDCLGIAESIVRIEGKEPHWSQSAQDLVCALIMYSRLVMNQKSIEIIDDDTGEILAETPWPEDEQQRGCLSHVRTLLGRPFKKMKHLVELIGQAARRYKCPEMAVKVERFADMEPDNKELGGIISTALTQTRWLDSRPVKADLAKGAFDFSEMKKRPVTVYLVLPARRLGTHSSWLRLMITSVVQQLMKDVTRARVPCLLMLDEYYALASTGNNLSGGSFPVIDNNMAMFRGYGIKLWTVWQDLNQPAKLYGKDGFETFIANAGVVQTFAAEEVTTAEYFSKMTGTKSGKNWTYGSSIGPDAEPSNGNMGYSTISVPLMRPDDFRSMHDGYAVLFSHKVKEGPIRSYLPYPTRLARMSEIMKLDPAG